MKKLLRRTLCLLGLHRWQHFPAEENPDPWACRERRTCTECGLWQGLYPDASGWASGSWERI